MEITGILVKQTSIREGVSKTNGNPWKIAEYLVEIPGQYPRHISFDVRDGQVGRIARFESLIGKTVTVSFDIDANEYQGRWYNTLGAWGILEYINTTQRAANMEVAQKAAAAPAPQSATSNQGVDKNDDLPF
jgi:hypothetical protein